MATNIIAINRGDSFDFDLEITDAAGVDASAYTLQGDDAVYFGLMLPNQQFEDALIKKKYTSEDIVDGFLTLHIYPEDTLDLLPGKYFYMIKLKQDHTDEETGNEITGVRTIVNKTKFVIYD